VLAGVLLLARTTDQHSGYPVIAMKHTTTLPKYMENTGYLMTFWKLGKQYRTYEVRVPSYLAVIVICDAIILPLFIGVCCM